MRTTNRCVKCGGSKFLDVTPQQTYCDAGGTLREITLTGAAVATGAKGFFGNDEQSIVTVSVEVSVCAACGYAEWWVPPPALDTLKKLAGHPAIRARDGAATATPFRG